jgi:hypothetical protein
VVVLDGETDLLQVVGASGAVGGLADLLDRGQKQAHQATDDPDHDEQFDKRKAGPAHVCLAIVLWGGERDHKDRREGNSQRNRKHICRFAIPDEPTYS